MRRIASVLVGVVVVPAPLLCDADRVWRVNRA